MRDRIASEVYFLGQRIASVLRGRSHDIAARRIARGTTWLADLITRPLTDREMANLASTHPSIARLRQRGFISDRETARIVRELSA